LKAKKAVKSKLAIKQTKENKIRNPLKIISVGIEMMKTIKMMR
jgi:hypothetical protein